MKIQFGSDNPIDCQKWMVTGGLSLLMFALSYFMAVTMPDCPGCSAHGDVSAMQIFHAVFFGFFAVVSVAFFVAAVVNFLEEWPR